jgi:excisionase family DNA binding protein
MSIRSSRGRARADAQGLSFDELLRTGEVAGTALGVGASRDFEASATRSRSRAAGPADADEQRWEPRALLSEPLLSASEAGALLGIPRSSVYDYAKRGELPHVRVGKHVKFIRQDLERALAHRRVGI